MNKMPAINRGLVVIGMQWGDEGKGKIVDLLAENAQAVVRFQGGHNAGHTIYAGTRKVVLHMIPSGILRNEVQCFIGNGAVLHLPSLIGEIESLNDIGVGVGQRLKISPACPLILNTHILLDKAREYSGGKEAIGTTCRGIGPVYEDKVARRALRIGDLFDSLKVFKDKFNQLISYHRHLLSYYCGDLAENIDADKDFEELVLLGEQIGCFVSDVILDLKNIRATGGRIIFEGAQGTMLSIDLGTYPYVTSSNTTLGNAIAGTGLSINTGFDSIIGIAKAYTTRVGAGYFPTELTNAAGEHLAKVGNEFGSTTGRARRCGWIDAVALRHAIEQNSIKDLCLTKLDVLDGLDEIKICTAYRCSAIITKKMPTLIGRYSECEPIYQVLPGWKDESVRDKKSYWHLPENAQNYISTLERILGVRISIISTGPERESTIIRRDFFSHYD